MDRGGTKTKMAEKIMAAVFVLSVMAVLPSRGYAQEQEQAGKGASPQTTILQQSTTAEETLVKTAYGKLSLYHRAANAKRARETNVPYNPDKDIKFVLRKIHTGPIEEIYNRPYGEMVTKPTGDIISVVPSVHTWDHGPEDVFFEAKWITSNYTSTALEDWENTTVREALQLIGDAFADVGEYTSYEVTVSLMGKERTYQAMVLYHGPLQSAVEPKVEFLDNIVGQTALTSAFKERRLPTRPSAKRGSPTVKTDSATQDDSEAFAKNGDQDGVERGQLSTAKGSKMSGDHRLRRGAHLEVLAGGVGMICTDGFCCVDDPFSCDPTSCFFGDPFVCGPVPALNPIATPCNFFQRIGAGDFRDTLDSQFHIFGNHEAKTSLQNTCLINEDCSVVCRVEITSSDITDTGVTTNSCHVTAKSSRFSDGSTDCQATAGYAVKSCFLCACSISISIGPVGVTSDGFWTTEHTFGGMCSSDGTPTP